MLICFKKFPTCMHKFNNTLIVNILKLYLICPGLSSDPDHTAFKLFCRNTRMSYLCTPKLLPGWWNW